MTIGWLGMYRHGWFVWPKRCRIPAMRQCENHMIASSNTELLVEEPEQPMDRRCVSCHVDILLMVQKSGDHQLRLVAYPIIYKVFYEFSMEHDKEERFFICFNPKVLLTHPFPTCRAVAIVVLQKRDHRALAWRMHCSPQLFISEVHQTSSALNCEISLIVDGWWWMSCNYTTLQ